MVRRELVEYESRNGRNHFREWFYGLDGSIRKRVLARIRRLGAGLAGPDRHLGSGLHEAKMDVGPGYRVYYGERAGRLILLLCGGDKSTQSRDIIRAEALWREFLEHAN